MKEIKGNLFDYPVICKTTNAVVKADGRLVMGKGIALQAKQRFKDIDLYLGNQVDYYGNRCFVYRSVKDKYIISFPTKHHWRDNSTLELIEVSTISLVDITNIYGFEKVYLPRVGCCNGKLDWKNVKPILEKHLDDRFIVVDYENK